MRSWWGLALVFYLVVGVLLLPLGFLWRVALEAAGERWVWPSFSEVEAAVLDDQERLRLCLSIEGQRTELVVPTHYEVSSIKDTRKDSYRIEIASPGEVQLFADLLQADCKAHAHGSSPSAEVRVVRVNRRDRALSRQRVAAELDRSVPIEDRPVVYVVVLPGDPAERMVVYLDRRPVIVSKHGAIANTNYLIPQMPPHREVGSRWWYLVVPIAGIVDVIGWPVELMLWVRYAGAH